MPKIVVAEKQALQTNDDLAMRCEMGSSNRIDSRILVASGIRRGVASESDS